MNKLRQDESIGHNLRALRKEHGFTQDRLVAKLQLLDSDTNRSVYSRYETGELNIKISDLRRLHKIYNCTYDAFFKEL